MAAKVVKMASVVSDSSDDEDLKRFQEAVWDIKKSGNGNVKQSKRVVVADHEHDGNELQVTEGFQTHVAKKLGQFLDSHFSDIQTEILICKTTESDDNEEGFRLFSTSIPGQPADDPPPPVQRRPIPSSSDSDSEMEMRLKEAAVSFNHLLPSSSAAGTPHLEKIKKSDGEEDSLPKKKKKKKKKRRVDDAGSTQVDCDGSSGAQSNTAFAASQHEHHQVKRKKKKQQNGNTEVLN
ncbi:protein CUSTOS [Dunckerocampus dactyliophorus]|uniref:protein CUSTOS n=1 Tax=Dunckerocampus dactyliophorus TaxID=161453 RepID=UPI0024063F62|nr:protein CUSTOS [Dunckerocampus dactyliophorus]